MSLVVGAKSGQFLGSEAGGEPELAQGRVGACLRVLDDRVTGATAVCGWANPPAAPRARASSPADENRASGCLAIPHPRTLSIAGLSPGA